MSFFFCIFCIYSTNIYKVLTELQRLGLAFGFNEMCVTVPSIDFYVLFFFLLACNYFTMLYWFLLYNEVHQLYVYIHTLSLELPSPHPRSHPSRSSQSSELFPALHSRFPLALYLTHHSVCMSVLLSQFFPFFPAAHVHTSVLYTCMSIPEKTII